MRHSQTLRRVAVFGAKWEAADIIDHQEQLAIVLGSVLAGLAVGIWVGYAERMWIGVIVGSGVYAICVRFGSHLFVRNQTRRTLARS